MTDTNVDTPTSAPTSSTSTVFIVSLIILSAAVVGLALASGFLWQRLNQVNPQFEQIDAALKSSMTRMADSESQVMATRKALTETVKRINQTDKDWQLAELNYFLSALTNDVRYGQTKQQLLPHLETIIAQVKQLGLPQLAPVEASLQGMRASLNQTPTIDILQRLAALDVLMMQIEGLPLKLALPDEHASEQTSATDDHTPDTATWRSRLKSSLTVLKDVVVIREHTQNVAPFIAPEAQQTLQLQLQLMLSQVKWALVMQNNAVYANSLGQLESWISRYFKTEDQAVQTVLGTLNTLQASPSDPLAPQRAVWVNELLALQQSVLTLKQQLNTLPETPAESEV